MKSPTDGGWKTGLAFTLDLLILLELVVIVFVVSGGEFYFEWASVRGLRNPVAGLAVISLVRLLVRRPFLVGQHGLVVLLDLLILGEFVAILLVIFLGDVDIGGVVVRDLTPLIIALTGMSLVRLAIRRPFLLAKAWGTGALRDAVFVFLVTRVAVVAVAFVSNLMFPRRTPRPWDLPFRHEVFADIFTVNDSGWYFSIAQLGYSPSLESQSNMAFFPLYPMLMRAVGWVGGGTDRAIWGAGILIAFVAFFAALVVLHRFTERVFGDRKVARRTILYLAVFPYSFFFTAVYAESLFLLLTLLSIDAAHRSRWMSAGIWGGLAALTRPYGILLVIPLALFAVAGQPAVRQYAWRGLAVSLVPACLGGWCLFNYSLTGDPLAWLHVNAQWGYAIGQVPGQRLLLMISMIRQEGLYDFFFWSYFAAFELLNAATGVLFLVLTPWVAKRLGLPFALYVVATLLVPFTGNQLESIGRYAAVLFPVFMVAGSFKSARLHEAVVIVSALFLALLVGLFVNWYPV